MRSLLLPLVTLPLLLSGCGWVNPNFHTIVWRDASDYTVAGALTRGYAGRPKVGYVQSEGEVPEQGSFKVKGDGAGITPQGVYIPTALIPVNVDGRFEMKFTVNRRFALIRIFAWDDVNGNNQRDLNERLGTQWDLKKEDQRGWNFNAPDWNQFNFAFTQ